jgi:2,4-dienoyl-CoA reductase-like NADH-dependent reductase (Old Yellow Enzyme family)/thioredoxin reductase
MPEFQKLFTPGEIGHLEIRNRIVMPPMATHLATDQGDIPDRLIDYYAARARGGVGLVVIESSFPSAVGHPNRIVIDGGRRIPRLKELAEAVRGEGAKVLLELNTHMGRQDRNPLSPSDVPHPITGVKGRPATIEDIRKLQQEYGEAAARVREAGFDGMMIHGGTGYLISEFLSPLVNRRADEYGGDASGRARFALEFVKKTREKVGKDFPLIFRMMSHERVPGGFGTEDAIVVARLFEEQGVDAIDVITGSAVSHEWTAPPTFMPPGCNTDVSGAIRKAVRIPVLVAGKINDPYLADRILSEGKADFVDIGRGLLADPDFVVKAREGRCDKIRKCIGCVRCGERIVSSLDPVFCTVNPAVGREKEFERKPVGEKKKVLVVGGGPAGMEAALVADQRGHEVTLLEKTDALGGNLILAAIPSEKEDLKDFLDFLRRQIKKSKIKVNLQKEATAESVKALAPDAVILAVGSLPFIVDIPGIRGENVLGFREILSETTEISGKSVVVWGAGLVGCEVACFLAEKGNPVTLIFPESEAAPDVAYPDIKRHLLKKLEENQIRIETGVRQFKEITSRGLAFINKDGSDAFIPAGKIILATGARPQSDLAQSLRGEVPELHEAGDCVAVRQLLEAIHEGANAALKI